MWWRKRDPLDALCEKWGIERVGADRIATGRQLIAAISMESDRALMRVKLTPRETISDFEHGKRDAAEIVQRASIAYQEVMRAVYTGLH